MNKRTTSEQLSEWQNMLPEMLEESDEAEVRLDEANPDVLRIHIRNAGRSKYALDFTCRYVDDREVRVELVDVEKDNRSVDEHTTEIQEIIQEYIRHIHECAQALHEKERAVT